MPNELTATEELIMGCLVERGGMLLPSDIRAVWGHEFATPMCHPDEKTSAVLNMHAGIEGDARMEGLIPRGLAYFFHDTASVKRLALTEAGRELAGMETQ